MDRIVAHCRSLVVGALIIGGFACQPVSLPAYVAPTEAVGSVRHAARHLSPYERGMADAERDVRNDALRQMMVGLPVQPFGIYQQIMLDEFGVEHVSVAGCMPDAADLSYVQGYNAVATAELTRRFGPDVIEQTRRRADRAYAALGPERQLTLW